MDVDAFKNILMTGTATPSLPPASLPAQPPQDSSGSTDSSSLSRQSIFDAMHDVHLESPRTSMEYDHESLSGEGDEGDESLQSSLLGPPTSRPVEEGPPAPPKHRHGRGFPQTVSFADFDESIPSRPSSSSRPHTPPVSMQRNSILRPSPQRTLSDLNKPLPPPPAEPEGSPTPASTPRSDGIAPQSVSTPISAGPEEQSHAKRAPPPPPSSRRQPPGNAQYRPVSSSNLNQAPAHGNETPPPPPPTGSGLKAAPTPPSTRRNKVTAFAPSPTAETPPHSPTSQDVPPLPDSRPMPPPPPRRHPPKTGPSVNRTPSDASRYSSNASQAPPPAPFGTAPPAPPPRRGVTGSTRSSLDGPPSSLTARRSSGTDYRRTSGQSFGSERSAMGQVDQAPQRESVADAVVSPSALDGQPRDILADLTAFQAEIDALRAAQEGRGG